MKENILIEPNAPIKAGTWGSWQLIYSVGDDGIQIGGGLKIGFHSSLLPVFKIRGDWSSFQCDSPEDPGFITAQCSGKSKAKLEMIEPPMLPGMKGPHIRCFRVTIEGDQLKSGEKIIINLGDQRFNGPGLQAQMIAEKDMEIRIDVDNTGDQKWRRLEPSPKFNIKGGKASQLRLNAPSIISFEEQNILVIQYLDEFGHPSSDRDPDYFIFQEEGLDKKTKSGLVEVKKDAPGFLTITGKVSDLPIRQHPISVREEFQKYNLYWGDLHGHSNFSDGLRSPEEYYSYARDVSSLDFCALSDHEPGFSFHEKPLPNPRDFVNPVWEKLKVYKNQFNDPGHFITFLAYEWTSLKHGHKCVYYLDNDQKVYPSFSPLSDTPEKLYKNLVPGKSMVITHHSAGGPAPSNLEEIDPKWEPLIEIYSCHGTSDAPGIGRPLWRTVKGQGFFVQAALNKGLPFGIIAGSDTHTSDPGNPIKDHPLFPHPHRVGIFAVYASKLTREALWDAFWSKRVYATTGERIFLDFRINNQLMGSQISIEKSVVCYLKIGGTTDLKSVEVINNGKLLYQFSPNSAYFKDSFEIKEYENGYIYIRVTQADDEMAWSGPIWIR